MKTMMLAILILALLLPAVAAEADDLMFLMLTAPRTAGASEASNRVWSEMAAKLRREGAQLTIQADKSVTLTQNYADGHLFWMHRDRHENVVLRFRHRGPADLPPRGE